MVKRGIGPKSLMERLKGCQELGYCLAMCCVWNQSIPLVWCPALPFIDQGGAGITDGRKRKTRGWRRSFEGARSSFPPVPVLLTWQTMSRMACSLILIGPCPGLTQQVGTSHLHRRMVRRARELSCDPTGSRWGSDHTSVTVDDVSSLLDCSGCRMLMSGSTSEG